MDNKIKIIKKKNPKYSLEFIELIEKKDYFYMVMDLCDGNLNDLLKKKNGNLNLTTIFEIIFQLNEILKLMNSKEIEYINLNPENILIKNKNSIHIKIYDYNSKIKNYKSFYLQALEVYQNKKETLKNNLWRIGLILYYLYFNQLPFIDNNKIILKKTHLEILDDLISKLIKNPNEKINWDDYFNHPFNKQQIIEIYINIENDETINKIINKFQQLKDSNLLLDGKKLNYKFNKGKHEIIIMFFDIIKNYKEIFSKNKDIIEIKFINLITNKVTDMSNIFNECSNLTHLDLSNFNTENVRNMRNMFNNCSNLTYLNLSNFNTKNVTNMSHMFNNCSNLTNLDLSNFNTENVRIMYNMFSGCSKLTNLDISNFNTKNVINMSGMFNNCSGLKNLV